MSKCGLCGREMRDGEMKYNSFGLLPPAVRVCSGCVEDLKSLYFGAPKLNENDYRAECGRIRSKYNNAAADAAIAQADTLRTAGTVSGGGGIGGVYSNPGSSMITLAKTIFYIISVLAILAGVALGNISYEFNIVLFLVTAVGGVLLAYLTGLFLAAFGHLVSDVKFIRSLLSTRK